jgi:hypothetical protein
MKFYPIKIFITSFFLVSLIIVFSSSNSGVSGQSTSGCSGSSCHQFNSNTNILVTGIPSTGYIPGNTYLLTLTITNNDILLNAAVFDLKLNTGSLQAGIGTTLINNFELTHSSKKSFIGNTTSWTFNWTAPNTASIDLTVFVAANAVNSNNNSAGDGFNTNNFTFTSSVTASTPILSDFKVTDITSNSAKITGKVNGNYSYNQLYIKYGLTNQNGNPNVGFLCNPNTALGDTNTYFEYLLTGLSSNTTYHYISSIPYSINPLQLGTISTSDSTFTTLQSVSIKDFDTNDFIIYPNPTQDFLFLKSDKNILQSNVSIFSLLGEKKAITVINKSINEILLYIKNLNRGIYFLVIENDNKIYKHIIQKN